MVIGPHFGIVKARRAGVIDVIKQPSKLFTLNGRCHSRCRFLFTNAKQFSDG